MYKLIMYRWSIIIGNCLLLVTLVIKTEVLRIYRSVISIFQCIYIYPSFLLSVYLCKNSNFVNMQIRNKYSSVYIYIYWSFLYQCMYVKTEVLWMYRSVISILQCIYVYRSFLLSVYLYQNRCFADVEMRNTYSSVNLYLPLLCDSLNAVTVTGATTSWCLLWER